ncbi:hypothetical protein, partial [Endozoicomonas acroporae]|uniref:hypothetical protein n=1 Tax=Endozoicomonas acroporae TaxID=1701104 RepID=UPI003D7BB153
FKKITRRVIRAVTKVFGPEVANMVGNIVAGIACGPAAPACVATWNYEFGRAMGASSGQAFKSAATAGASVWAFQTIGGKFKGPNGAWGPQGGVAHVGDHAITGGVISELQGGKFGHGFISAGFTKFATSNITWAANDDTWAGVAKRTSVASLIGGTTSELTGGKFANGARTAAMAHLFNAEGANIAKNMLAREINFWKQKVSGFLSFKKNENWSTKGLVAGSPDLSLSGMAAMGSGVSVKKGIYNSDSSIDLVTVAYGLNVSANTNVLTISYRGNDLAVSPVNSSSGFDASFHALVGGRASFSFTPPSSFDFTLDGGAGIGAGFHMYSIGKTFKE